MALADRIRPAVHRLRSTPLAYRRQYRMRGRRWMMHLYDELMSHEGHWLGVPTMKNPLDIWIYQEILHEVRPTAIVELGSAIGGGTMFFCNMLDLLELDAPVVTVDQSHHRFKAEHPRIHTITGDTRDPAVIDQVRALCEGRRVLLIHDASHMADVVYDDLCNYGPLISPGSYLIVEDGVTDFLGGVPGPVTAVERFLRQSGDFEVDERRERFLLSYNPRGYLRRKPVSSR
jgi:cephalosporin hydroxylase